MSIAYSINANNVVTLGAVVSQNQDEAREEESFHNPNLLPFGGFEVALLLSKLHDSAFAGERQPSGTMSFSPVSETARSGYLRSKMTAAQIGF